MSRSPGKITLVIADDEAPTRLGIRALVDAAGDIEVVGEAQDGFEVQQLTVQLKPRVLSLDLKMPGPFIRPADLLLWLVEHCPETAVLPYTGHGRDALLAQLKEAGAVGYLQKSDSPAELVNRIRLAAAGKRYFAPEQEEAATRWNEDVGKKWKSLTPREREVALWMAKGGSGLGIARLKGLSQRTVESHIQHVLRKLGMKKQYEVMNWVLQHFPDEVGGLW